MTLDFEVVVEELTDEILRDHYRRSSNFEELIGDPELWGNISRQIWLQRALLEDEEALRRFITFVVADEVDASTNSLLGEVFGVGGERSEEDILGPVFSRLGEEDARYFREVSGAGELFENIEVLSRSFKVRWTAATLEEIKGVAQGTPGESESDKSYVIPLANLAYIRFIGPLGLRSLDALWQLLPYVLRLGSTTLSPVRVPVGAVQPALRAVAVLLPAPDALELISLVSGCVLLQHPTLGRRSVGLHRLGGSEQLVEPCVQLPQLLQGQAPDRPLYLIQLRH